MRRALTSWRHAVGRRSVSTSTWASPPPGTKVFVAMSGGVDSSVVARLLLERGYGIQPVFMRNWDTLDESSESGGCEWERDWAAVEEICRKHLGGCHPRLLDLSRQYWTDVFEVALGAWAQGVTPNPDVNCNQHIKFQALPTRLFEQDKNAWLATGHYARLLPSPLDPSQPSLHRATYLPKDQSYYLSTSPMSALSRTMFPLGTLKSKHEVRELARKWRLPTAEREESMGICFVGERRSKFADFLEGYLESTPGDIVEHGSEKIVGRHRGLWRYTIGERAKIGGLPNKMYVAHKDISRNVIVIAPRESPSLQSTTLNTADFVWSAPQHPPTLELDSAAGFLAQAQTRSLQEGSISDACVRRRPDGSLQVELETPLWGASPGQAVVLYRGSWCLGGGTIAHTRTAADIIDDA